MGSLDSAERRREMDALPDPGPNSLRTESSLKRCLFEHAGHIQIDFGLDSPFLYEERSPDFEAENRIRSNVQKLVEFTANVEKNPARPAGCSGPNPKRTSRKS